VDFPLTSLEMNPFVNSGNQPRALYDLYAVSNHYGSLNGGHYTAFCHNFIENNWYEFDDTGVSLIKNHQNIVGKQAYVLFYKLKSKGA
jgi:ubiquitin carboxyl-terminal hydrolase 4/11/15